MKLLFRLTYSAASFVLVLCAILLLAALGAYYYVLPSLPGVSVLREVQLQVPLRVYTRDGRLIAEYGEMRRIPLAWEDTPEQVVNGFLAAEDDRFFQHPGVDYQGLIRAAVAVLMTGEKSQGGGTITMQVARNFFLSREKTISRKVREIFLAFRIENELTKQEILTLYLNKIFLGQRAYGVGAAAEVYFGKTVAELTLEETATIAGLPKAPSRDNPVTDPQAAKDRRAYVLRRMLETGYIENAQYESALAKPMISALHSAKVEAPAPYVGEMVRRHMLDTYGPSAYTAGFVVTTTIDSRLQEIAARALRSALLAYDVRHGYRGPIAQVPWPADAGDTSGSSYLEGYRASPGMEIAIVTSTQEQQAAVMLVDGRELVLDWDGLRWARAYIDNNTRGPAPKTAADILAAGDIVAIAQAPDETWRLTQTPAVQGALVALDPMDGAVVSLMGGFNFHESKYNRATQSKRQPGSSFKPLIYSAALENGFTTATIVNDAPVVFEDATLEDTWRPENYSQKFFGPTRLREALVHSRNLVSIRVLLRVGVSPAIAHLRRFGFPEGILPRNLSLALGSLAVSPMQMADAYTTLANGGYDVTPYFIQRIAEPDGTVVFEADPLIACAICEDEIAQALLDDENRKPAYPADDEDIAIEDPIPFEELEYAPASISRQNAWLVGDMMKDVIRRGSGRRANSLGRKDLSGKTGTTNDRNDAWFNGFNADLVVSSWVGFDQTEDLGAREEGARTALPMWIAYMKEALAGVPNHRTPKPPGLVTVRISPQTGQLARAGEGGAIFETFRVGQVPESGAEQPDDPFAPQEEEETLF
jgi:penicillin-binding protein 1A